MSASNKRRPAPQKKPEPELSPSQDMGDIDMDELENIDELLASDPSPLGKRKASDREDVAQDMPSTQLAGDTEAQDQHDAKRSASRLNQVRAADANVTTNVAAGTDAYSKVAQVVARNDAPAGKGVLPPVVSMPTKIGAISTVFGLAKNLQNLQIMAASAESIYSDVLFYIVDVSDKKKETYYTKNFQRLLTRDQADKELGLQRNFRAGPVCAVTAMVKDLGILGDMSQARDGVPRYAMRNQLLFVGPAEGPNDAEQKFIPTGDGKFLRVPSYKQTSENTLEDLKRIIKHLFGCIYDGNPYGTEKLREVCLTEVLMEMSREHPGSRLDLPTSGARTLANMDDKPKLMLASGKPLTLDDPDVKKRVRELFIHKGVAPFRSKDDNPAHWSDPGTILLARRKVFHKMNAKAEEQAKRPQNGKRPVWGSWPAKWPEPPKEEFDDPSKTKRCIWYAQSDGYDVTPLEYVDQRGKPFELPVEELNEQEDDNHNEHDSGHAATSEFNPIAPVDANSTTNDNEEPVVFTYKRPKYKPRVLSNGSIIGLDLRLRLWCTKPSKSNLTGGYGVHVDFGPKIIMVERRVNDTNNNNYDMMNAFGQQMTTEEMNAMAVGTAEFAPMVGMSE